MAGASQIVPETQSDDAILKTCAQHRELGTHIIFETANGTTWSSLQTHLAVTRAHVVFAQEVKIFAEDIPEASVRARRLGWHAFIEPCIRTAAGGRSAGVAIFTRRYLDAYSIPGAAQTVVPHRVVKAHLRTRTLGEVALYAAYSKDGL